MPLVAVRVRLRVRSLEPGKEVVTSALVASAFESEAPRLLVPRGLAVELGLWPPPEEAYLVEVGTAGAPLGTTLYLAPRR